MNLESNTYYLSSSNEKIDNSFTLIRLAIYPCCEVRNCYDLNFQSKMLFLKRLLWQLRDLHKYNVFLNFESNHVNYIMIAWNFDKILLKNQWREKFSETTLHHCMLRYFHLLLIDLFSWHPSISKRRYEFLSIKYVLV